MTKPRGKLWRGPVTALVVVLALFLVGWCGSFKRSELTTVYYGVQITCAAQPRQATILLPAALLDGREMPDITREMAKRSSHATLTVNERGTFYRFTERSVNPANFTIVAYTTVFLNERVTRGFFRGNHLTERFDLSGQIGPDGHWGYWVYVDSDVPVTSINVRAYLFAVYTVYDVQILDSPKVEIDEPKNGWTWVKGEEGP